MGLEKSVQRTLNQIGLSDYSASQLRQKASSLTQQIQTGLKRTDSTQIGRDNGVAAIDTHVSPLTQEEWSRVPEGKSVIACAFAGTNWIVNTVTKENGKAQLGKNEVKVENLIENRTVTYGGFISRMADQIEKVSKNNPKLDTVAIALGFAHENIIEGNENIDARILSDNPGKFWKITDYKDHEKDLVGKSLLEELKRRKCDSITKFVIQNDTNAVAHATSTSKSTKLPAGFVFGTGDNASLGKRNLEVGYAIVNSEDDIFLEMKKRKYISEGNQNNLIEYMMGGDYIKFRAIAALGLLQDQKLINTAEASSIISSLMTSDDGAIISKIASNKIGRRKLGTLIHEEISPDTYSILQEIASRSLRQAGQMMGVVIAAVAQSAGYNQTQETTYNVEGSVYWKGYKVQEEVKKTLTILSPENRLRAIEASGLIGIAQLGMARMASA